MPDRPTSPRGPSGARCQSSTRPESSTQGVYTALRKLELQLAHHATEHVRGQAVLLAHGLKTYRGLEKLLSSEQSMRRELEVGLEAAKSLDVLLDLIDVLEAEKVAPNLSLARRAVTQRRDNLQTLAWRARLELCARARSASKQ